MKYNVLIFPTAESDILEIKEYFEKEFSISADPLIGKFIDVIELLEDNPFMHPLVRDVHLARKGYRLIHVDNYLVFSKIVDDTVQILRFLYGKRLYSQIL